MARKKKETHFIQNPDKVINKPMENVMHDSIMPYAEYVIMERALPRVEDGLKPVQRRILYTMHELALTPDKPHKKSARIVGDALGKYHPHGDTSVYDAICMARTVYALSCRWAQNFGSIDSDPQQQCDTEARMTPCSGAASYREEYAASARLNDPEGTDVCPAVFPIFQRLSGTL